MARPAVPTGLEGPFGPGGTHRGAISAAVFTADLKAPAATHQQYDTRRVKPS
jgi:hypothetical protein